MKKEKINDEFRGQRDPWDHSNKELVSMLRFWVGLSFIVGLLSFLYMVIKG